jgi:hypothetical protein
MDEGLRFAIREGGRTVGAGVVTKIRKSHGMGHEAWGMRPHAPRPTPQA